MNAVIRIVTDTILLAGLLLLAMIVYTLYAGDYEIINAIHCKLTTESDLGYAACRLINN